MRYFTSDHHFGHKNIINFARRPFHSVDNMNFLLLVNWNEVVTPEDEVYIIGDLAMGQIKDTLPLVNKLHGRKHLICGNHDRCWSGLIAENDPAYQTWNTKTRLARLERSTEKVNQWRDKYKANGIETINSGSVPIKLSNDVTVLMNHFPYTGDSRDDDRFAEWRPEDKGQWLLHGHVHSRERIRDKQIHVGVDAWNYAPVSEEQIIELIEEK